MLQSVRYQAIQKSIIPFNDEEALEWLVFEAKKSVFAARMLVNSCRKGALEQGLRISDPCHFRMAAGMTLKQTIPTLGPCLKNLKYLKDWNISDVPTMYCLVSGAPIALRETINQNLTKQLKTLGQIETRWGVPVGFFSRELLPTVYTAGVALACRKVTKQKVFGNLIVRTGTCGSDGGRLVLRWRQGRLYCDDWYWDGDGGSGLAVAPLGVTRALGR